MKILYIRTNDISFDSRVEKELLSLVELPNTKIDILGWNRDGKNTKQVHKDLYSIADKSFDRYLIDIYAPWGRGGKKNMIPLFSFMKSVKKWLKKHIDEYDVIHCVDLPTAYYATRVAKRHGKKVVYDIFDYFADLKRYPKPIKWFFSRKENKCISQADVTIICTDERRKQIVKAKYKTVEVIHNSPDITNAKLKKVSKGEPIKFCYVGNLMAERSIDLIIEYFKKHQEHILEIGGVGSLSDFVSDVSHSYSNIHFHGKMKYDDVLTLEQECDVLFALYDPSIPNHRYVAPNKFYEALSLGKRLICYKNTGLDEYFNNYDIGVMIEPNISSMEKGVETLIERIDSWEKAGKEEQELFETTFSWKIMKKRLQDIYLSFGIKHE